MANLTKEVINQRMKELGVRQTDIVRATGTTKAAVSNWVNGVATPKGDDYRHFVHCLGLMINESGDLVPIDNAKKIKSKRLPILTYVQAGSFSENQVPDAVDEMDVPKDDVPNDSAFLLTVEGDSMYNPADPRSLNPGDVVLVNPLLEAKFGNIVIARCEHATTIKKLAGDPTMPLLVPLNPQYQAISQYNIEAKRCHIIGVAVKRYSSVGL